MILTPLAGGLARAGWDVFCPSCSGDILFRCGIVGALALGNGLDILRPAL